MDKKISHRANEAEIKKIELIQKQFNFKKQSAAIRFMILNFSTSTLLSEVEEEIKKLKIT